MNVLVPVTVMTVVGANELSQLVDKKPPTMRPIIAGFIVGIGLYALVAVDTRLGNLFCGLVITGTLVDKGPKLFGTIGGLLK